MTADRTASFLFSEMPELTTDPNTVDDTPAEVYLKKLFNENNGLSMLNKWAIRGFLAGHSYIRVKPAKKKFRKERYPKISLLNPLSVTTYWAADDTADVLWYEMRYFKGEQIFIQDYVWEDDNNRWMIYTYAMEHPKVLGEIEGIPTLHDNNPIWLDSLDFAAGNWVAMEKPKEHTSAIPPIIETAHLPDPENYYGQSEFTLKDLQDAINRIASERQRIVRETADPVDVITGADLDEVQDDGALLTIPNPNARASRLEMKGNLAAVSETLDKMVETYLAISRVVLLKGEAKDLQRVTNASVRTLFLDALAKNTVLQDAYGRSISRIAKVALEMGYEAGMVTENPKDIDVRVSFGSPLPIDKTEIANQNALALNGGYRSKRTAAKQMGDDWTYEADAIASEFEENMERQQQAMELAASFQEPMPANESKKANEKPQTKNEEKLDN